MQVIEVWASRADKPQVHVAAKQWAITAARRHRTDIRPALAAGQPHPSAHSSSSLGDGQTWRCENWCPENSHVLCNLHVHKTNSRKSTENIKVGRSNAFFIANTSKGIILHLQCNLREDKGSRSTFMAFKLNELLQMRINGKLLKHTFLYTEKWKLFASQVQNEIGASAQRYSSSFKLFIGVITSILSPYRSLGWSGIPVSLRFFNYSCLWKPSLHRHKHRRARSRVGPAPHDISLSLFPNFLVTGGERLFTNISWNQSYTCQNL